MMIRLLCLIRQRHPEAQASIGVRIDTGSPILAFERESKPLVGSEAVACADTERLNAIRAVGERRSGADSIAVRQPPRTDSRKNIERADDLLLHRPVDAGLQIVRLVELERRLHIA